MSSIVQLSDFLTFVSLILSFIQVVLQDMSGGNWVTNVCLVWIQLVLLCECCITQCKCANKFLNQSLLVQLSTLKEECKNDNTQKSTVTSLL